MARRIHLPRLTRRQRLARWQRERRQQAIYLVAFTTILVAALGLVAWAAATRYYDENLATAVRVAGRNVPLRDLQRRISFEQARFLVEANIGEAQESHPSIRAQRSQFRARALEDLVRRLVLEELAREEGALPSDAETRARLDRDLGELRVRHVLVAVDAKEQDRAKADADAKAKAEAVATQLGAEPMNEQLWKDVAKARSDDPSTKERGGELGWVNTSSGFVKEFEAAMYALADGEIGPPVKSSFGYHVIQRIESRPATRTPLFARARRLGLGLEDFLALARTAVLGERYEQRAREAEIPGSQEQVRLAVIRVRTGTPAQAEQYLAGLRKIQAVVEGLEKGQDFAELAKQHSDDSETKEKGGEIGWVTRAMLAEEVAEDVFARQAGERSNQHETAFGEISIFKVLEKADAREVSEEQKARIREGAFARWFATQEKRLGVERLASGLEP